MSGRRLTQAGVTLAEMLAVIVIIASLASVLLPAFSSAKRSAKGQVCASNLKQMYFSAVLYQGDNDDRYPYGINGIARETKLTFGMPHGSDPDGYPLLGELFAKLMRGSAAIVCPLDQGRGFLSGKIVARLADHNAGSSYLCAELVEDQTSGTWPNPAADAYCIDGSPAWHAGLSQKDYDALPYQESRKTGLQNTLFYDGHVKISPPFPTPCWRTNLCRP